MERFKVIQVATGSVGMHSLRAIIGRDDMELVGLLAFSPDKAGVDAGELIGDEQIGVVATNDFDEIVAMDADIVSYNALGETSDAEAALDQICRLLESGKNVCSTAVSVHLYPDIITSTDLSARLTAACEKGGVSFHSSGINPGFMMDVWPITLCRLARHIDTIYMTEMVDMCRYTSAQIAEYIGFGQQPEDMAFVLEGDLVHETSFYASLKMFADATGLDFDHVTLEREGRPSDRPIETPACHVEPGEVGAVRFVLRAFLNGKIRVENQWVWVLDKDVTPADWPYGDGSWTVKIVGDPCLETRIDTRTTRDAGQPDVLMTGMHEINAIPSVVSAPVGIMTHLDLPLFSGGFFGSVEERGNA